MKTIAEIVGEEGKGTLKALFLLKENKLANAYKESKVKIDNIITSEGIIPFEERPLKTQRELDSSNKLEKRIFNVLWKHRNKKVKE